MVGPERTFGKLCRVHMPGTWRVNKLGPIAFDGIYLGVHSTTQSRIYNPYHRAVEIHTNVKVFEDRSATHLLEGLAKK